MLVLSNRDVYLFCKPGEGGLKVIASWLKDKAISGTEQQLWDREEGAMHSTVKIPPNTAQIHTDTFFPYVTAPMETGT